MAKSTEAKQERFRRIAEARTTKLIDLIRSLGNLSSPNCDYPLKWVDQIFVKLRAELDQAESRLRERYVLNSGKRFSLTEPCGGNEIPAETSASDTTHWVFDSPVSYYCAVCGTPGVGDEPAPEDLCCRYCGRQVAGHSEHRYDPKDVNDNAYAPYLNFAGGE